MKMNNSFAQISLLVFLFSAMSCMNTPTKEEKTPIHNQSLDQAIIQNDSLNLLTDYSPIYEDGDLNVVIEIPAGSLEKWEVDKTDGKVKLQHTNGKPRLIDYLSYPANYGMIPRTILPKELGGDGDPLDVILLGPKVERGSIVKCKLLGILYLYDRGEQDDKIIAVMNNSPFYAINSMSDLKRNYPGMTEILQLWFTNYKGAGILQSDGFGEKEAAAEVLHSAIEAYNEMAFYE